RHLQALEKTSALLLPGNMQEELEHQRAVVGERALEGADVLEPLLLDARRHKPLGQHLALEQFGMHAHHQDLLVVRAVEDADPPARRQPPRAAPEKVVVKLLGARCLERMHLAAYRIDARYHMLDDAVLAARIHPLENDQDGPAALGGEPLLQIAQAL